MCVCVECNLCGVVCGECGAWGMSTVYPLESVDVLPCSGSPGHLGTVYLTRQSGAEWEIGLNELYSSFLKEQRRF